MYALFFVLLRILFPLDPVARLGEVTRHYLGELLDRLEDDACLHELLTDHHARALFEAEMAAAEDGIHMLIHERARQLLGLPFIYTSRNNGYLPRHGRPIAEVLARFQRVVALHDNLERLAHRRAERLRNALETNPLRLAAPPQSTSPSLRLVEDSALLLEVLHRRRRGRWIGATSRRDGGGCALARGPPSHPARLPIANCRLPQTLRA